MKQDIEMYILKHGLSAFLKQVMEVCQEQAETTKERNPVQSARWYKAEVKIYQLSTQKFIQPL